MAKHLLIVSILILSCRTTEHKDTAIQSGGLHAHTFDRADSYSFNKFSPPRKKMKDEEGNRISFPRTYLTKFRGTVDKVFSEIDAIRAMFGDDSVFVESKFHSHLKARLMDEPSPVEVSLNNYLTTTVEKIIKDNGGPLKEEFAAKMAAAIIDESFEYYEKKNWVKGRYLDYNSKSYQDWPNDLVFTTIVQAASATYGNRVIEFEPEKRVRSIDLNYWNKIKNDVWHQHTRDTGEFITPGYIHGSEIVGYQVRSGKTKSWHKILYSLYKIVEDGQTYVGVFAQRKSNCMIRESNTIYLCNYKPNKIFLSPHPISGSSPSFIGYFTLCYKRAVCNEPSGGLFSSYQVRNGFNDSDFNQLKSNVERIKIRSKSIKFIPSS